MSAVRIQVNPKHRVLNNVVGNHIAGCLAASVDAHGVIAVRVHILNREAANHDVVGRQIEASRPTRRNLDDRRSGVVLVVIVFFIASVLVRMRIRLVALVHLALRTENRQLLIHRHRLVIGARRHANRITGMRCVHGRLNAREVRMVVLRHIVIDEKCRQQAAILKDIQR